MGALLELWDAFLSFLAEYDAARLMELLRELDWSSLLANPIVWVVTLSLLVIMIWKKQFTMLVLVCSLVAFVVLLQSTLPPEGEAMELSEILKFIGGSALLAGLNLYFLLVRQ